MLWLGKCARWNDCVRKAKGVHKAEAVHDRMEDAEMPTVVN